MDATVPTLDLHGYRRDEAIQQLITFLNSSSNHEAVYSRRGRRLSSVTRWVRVVTGSGAHSGHGGPVLKYAVENYLQGKFQYRLERSGVFLVDTASGSGSIKYDTSPATKCTKVVVVETTATAPSIKPAPILSSQSFDSALSPPLGRKQSPLKDPSWPRHNSAPETDDLSQALKASQLEYNHTRLIQKQEEETLNQTLLVSSEEEQEVEAMRQSLLMFQLEQAQAATDESRLLELVLSESLRGHRTHTS
jgi:Smr domain